MDRTAILCIAAGHLTGFLLAAILNSKRQRSIHAAVAPHSNNGTAVASKRFSCKIKNYFNRVVVLQRKDFADHHGFCNICNEFNGLRAACLNCSVNRSLKGCIANLANHGDIVSLVKRLFSVNERCPPGDTFRLGQRGRKECKCHRKRNQQAQEFSLLHVFFSSFGCVQYELHSKAYQMFIIISPMHGKAIFSG